MTPANEALAYRIWAFCEPLGWNVSVKDIAEEMGCSWQRARTICQHRRWLNRLRKDADKEYAHKARTSGFVERQLDALNRWSA